MYSSPGIFNALDDWGAGFGMGQGRSNTDNASAMQAAIDAAQASGNPCGAIVLIPSANQLGSLPEFGAYPIGGAAGSTIITIPASGYPDSPLLICGTGKGTELIMQTEEASPGQNVLFQVSDTANVTFQDLKVSFDGTHENSQTGVAFYFSGGTSHKLFRVEVVDCQYPVVIDGTDGVAIRQCHLNYGNGLDSSITDLAALQVLGGATQTSVADCVMGIPAGDYPDYPFRFVGISIGESSFTRVRDTQVYGFNYCVIVGSGIEGSPAIGTTFAAVFIAGIGPESGPAITVQPSVFDLSFVDCHCKAPNGYDYLGTGIQVGQVGDVSQNQYIDTVRFTSCTLVGGYGLTGDAAFGMAINAGQNIQVIGGKYSGCGDTGGITVAGPATEIQIIGATCIGPEYGFESATYSEPFYQVYGIVISAGQDIQIINVNCSGSGTPTLGGAGIYMSPADGATISDVKIIGAICTNPVLEEAGSSTVLQEYGIYADQVSNLLIQGCTLTGNILNGIYLQEVSEATVAACDLYSNAQGLYVGEACSSVFIRDNNITGYAGLDDAITFASSGSLTQIEVTDCAGYNDQKTLLFGPSTPPTVAFTAVSLHGYYGPSTFYLSAGLQSVKIDGYATNLSSGVFTLAPEEYAQIISSGVTGTMLMIGT
jgi:parallel beta-helix repeat protein